MMSMQRPFFGDVIVSASLHGDTRRAYGVLMQWACGINLFCMSGVGVA